jgi:fatty-acyl-CoA synthase
MERTPAGLRRFQAGTDGHADELNTLLLQKHFAKWQLPERYETIDAVPRTSTGKFWKLKLRERFPS